MALVDANLSHSANNLRQRSQRVVEDSVHLALQFQPTIGQVQQYSILVFGLRSKR